MINKQTSIRGTIDQFMGGNAAFVTRHMGVISCLGGGLRSLGVFFYFNTASIMIN